MKTVIALLLCASTNGIRLVTDAQPPSSLIQKKSKEDNLEAWMGKIQSIAGPHDIGGGYIGDSVHTLGMTSGNPYPDEDRERLKNTNNSWNYPTKMDNEIPPHSAKYTKAHEKVRKEKSDKVIEENQKAIDDAVKHAEDMHDVASRELKEYEDAQKKEAGEPIKALVQINEPNFDNHEPKRLQSVKGPNLGAPIGESTHTMAMASGDANPEAFATRDRLKNTNNMWHYPKYLDPTHKPYQHIPMPGTVNFKSSGDDAEIEAAAKKAGEALHNLDKASRKANKEAVAAFKETQKGSMEKMEDKVEKAKAEEMAALDKASSLTS